MNLLILFMVNNLSVSLNSSYITKFGEMIADLPVAVFFLKPTIEYGKEWGEGKEIGILAENFYTSLDCDDPENDINVELGANCLKVGPFYTRNIGKFKLAGTIGILRIDIAGLAYGSLGGSNYAGPIDEGRTGGFGGVKTKYMFTDVLSISPFISIGIIKDGNFLEYGANLSFKLFKNREVAKFLKPVFFNTGISFMRLEAKTEEQTYPLFFGYYLVGIGYDIWEETISSANKRKGRR